MKHVLYIWRKFFSISGVESLYGFNLYGYSMELVLDTTRQSGAPKSPSIRTFEFFFFSITYYVTLSFHSFVYFQESGFLKRQRDLYFLCRCVPSRLKQKNIFSSFLSRSWPPVWKPQLYLTAFRETPSNMLGMATTVSWLSSVFSSSSQNI